MKDAKQWANKTVAVKKIATKAAKDAEKKRKDAHQKRKDAWKSQQLLLKRLICEPPK